MRIFDLALKNIGPFNEESFKLREDVIEGGSVTMITGMNGSGKSVIIDAIRMLLLGIHSDKLERNVIRNERDFFIKAKMFDGYERRLLRSQEILEKRGLVTSNPSLNIQVFEGSIAKLNWILDYWSSFINKDSYKINSIQAINPEDYLENSLVGNKPNTDVAKLITFFDYLKGSNKESDKTIGEYMFNQTVAIINSCLSYATFSHVSRTTLEPIIETQNAEVTFDKLSSGNSYLIQRLLSLLSQAYSVYRRNGGEIDKICDVPGLLLMDEAEHHLHPKWQKTFLQTILRFFPNLQIILTTHSPFLISSVENTRILVTKSLGDHSIVEDATDYYANKPVEEILRTTLFETDSFNKEISDLLKERKEAIRNDDDEKAEAIEGELIKENPEYFKYLNIDKLGA